jgi:hypothetical protein
MNSWKLFGAASAAVLTMACTASGQSCGSPLAASLGDTAVATSAGVTLNLSGICDPGPFGDDSLYNVSWYSFVAPSSGQFTVQTCGTVNYDSRLAVLTDCNNAGSTLACNDDGGSGTCMTTTGLPYASSLCFTGEEGVTYYIAVGGYSAGDQGSGTMNIAEGCGGGTECELPTGITYYEARTCGGDSDGGCNGGGATEFVNVGDVIAGTYYANASTRDTDWYTFSVATDTQVTATLYSSAHGRVAIANQNCAALQIFGDSFGTAGCPVTATACLEAGTYYLIILPHDFVDILCDTPESNYVCEFTGFETKCTGASCDASAQDCCVANSMPFCSDSECCATVCAVDPYCCQTAWDGICADEASTMCSICGGGGSTACGKGSNDCCVANAGPFCNDFDCCTTVCAFDPYCCETAWDGICADEAAANCANCSGGDPNCGTGANDCCVANATPYCTDAECCNTVCAVDPYCCATAWDSICANEAASMCTVCGGGGTCGKSANDCCVAATTPACSDAECCEVICAADPYCCQTAWDGLCSGAAAAQCAACILECELPSCSVTEAEPCGGDTNGGCNGGGATEFVALGDSICGTFWASTAMRDTDWYTFTLTEDTLVTASLYTEGPGRVAIANTNCAALFIFGDTFGMPAACPRVATACIPAGDYYAIVLPEVFADVPCDSNGSPYVLTLSGEPCVPVVCGSGKQDCCVAGAAPYCSDAECCTQVCAIDPFCCSTQWDGICASEAGTMCSACMGPPPENDECSGRIEITDGVTPFSTTGATDSGPALDPSCEEGFGLAFVKDIWFTYEATCDGDITVSTCNDASYDTRLAAYDACPDLGGILVACNDDGPGCAGFTSTMVITGATAGNTYLIRVGGFGGGGTGNLTITCGGGGGGDTNDECDTPDPAVDGANAFTNVGSTSGMPNASPAFCGAFATGFYNDVWFTYTPSMAGVATFSTCNTATFDTRLELWLGCPDAGGVLVACNDDGAGCTGFTSLMTADLACDTKYLVRVGAYSTTGFGSGTLTITPGSTPCSVPCPADFNDDGVVDGADLGSLLGEWGACPGCPQDLNGDGVVDGADLGGLLGEWGPCD